MKTSRKRGLAITDFLDIDKATPRSALVKNPNDGQNLDRLLGNPHPGFVVVTQRDEVELYYRLIKIEYPPKIEPRIWTPVRCPDPTVPYLWVQFPPTDWKKIVVAPLSDLQWGSRSCRYDDIRAYVDWIRVTPNVFSFINGDVFDNALYDSVGGAIYDNDRRPLDQVKDVTELLKPIAHKIMWALPGNHEERTSKKVNLDPLEIVCDQLDIPYYNQPIFSNILWRDNRFNFYSFHGTSGSQTMGGNLNAAARPLKWQEFTMFVIMGHVHVPMANPITRRCVVREYSKGGKLKKLRIIDREQYLIICSAWLKFWGSYAHKAGYDPPPHGNPFAHLSANGTYEISQ